MLSWTAWETLRSAAAVLAPAGHPLLPALNEAGIPYQLVEGEPEAGSLPADGDVMWLPEPGDIPPVPAGARLLRGSADLPGAHLLDLVATMDRLRRGMPLGRPADPPVAGPAPARGGLRGARRARAGDEQAFARNSATCCCRWCSTRGSRPSVQTGGYTIDDVADGIVAKLIRRHPHVFGDVTVSGADEVYRNWDEIKRAGKERAERAGVPADADGPPSALDGVPFGQPALALAGQLQRRAARAGVPDELARLEDWDRPELAGPGGDIGRELFRLAVRAREAGRDPEMELRAAARRYRDLVRAWEQSWSAESSFD